MRKSLIVLQEGNKDCGAACLLSIIRYYGGDISLERLIVLTKTGKEGTSFYNLSEASKYIGLSSKAYKVDSDMKMQKINTPFIAQISNKNYMHFVVVYKIDASKVLIMDPSFGKKNMDLFDFVNVFTGNIMLFEKIINLPILKGDKLLNKIIVSALFKNVNIIFYMLLLSLIFVFLSVITTLYSQTVFDKVLGTTINNLTIITVMFSVLIIIKIVTEFIRNYLVLHLNQKLDINIILSTFTKIVLLPFYYYKNKTTGEVLSRVNDLFSIKVFISKIIISVFLDSITFFTSFIVIYFISKKILFVLLLMSFCYMFILLVFNYPIKYLTGTLQENNAMINSNIVETVSSFETIKGLNIENNVLLEFSKLYSKLIGTIYKKEKLSNIMHLLEVFVNDIGLLVVSYLTFRSIISNELTTGNYLTISFLSGYLIYPVKNMLDILNEFHYVKNSITRANNLLDIDEEKIHESNFEVKGDIVFNNLNYSYNNKNNILNNVSFYIKEKDRVMVLGESGAGKSTLMKLLYKYCLVDRGMIFINGIDINDYALGDIRRDICYISQEEAIFTGSIRNNIVLDRDIDEREFLKVCKMTFVDEIVKDSILGYDFLLEENGINLSGGQRQRIILARSILKSSNIMLIDEGLNEIDIDLERKILVNLFNEYRNVTFIIISHRKDNMNLYNRMIIVNKEGIKNYERSNV